MAINLATAYIEIVPTAKNIGSNLDNELVDPAEKVGERAGQKYAEGFTRDANGRLRDANGKFVKAGGDIGEGLVDGGKSAGGKYGDGFTRDVNGRLRDEHGKFVKSGEDVGDKIGDGVSKSAKGGKLKGAFDGLAKAGAAAFAVFAGAQVFSGFVSEAEEAQKTTRQTEAVLKSMGGAADVSAGDVDNLAASLSTKSGVDDEVIASSENVLLTFGKVRNEVGDGNDIFTQATKSALDMSAALGTDLQSSTIMLGKALNDPVKGITAMQKAGVSFTQQQKDQIKTMVASGDTLGAQKLIMSELEKQFGGSAEANATSSAKMGVAFGNLQEILGTALLPVFDFLSKAISGLTDVMPGIIESLGNFGGEVADVFQTIWDNKPVLIGLISGIAGVATAIVIGLVPAFVAWTVGAAAAAAATIVAAAPFIAIGAAIAGVAAGLVWAYQNVEWFRTAVDAVKEWIVSDFVPAVTAAWEWIRDAAVAAWPVISAIVTTVAEAIGKAIGFVVDDVIPVLVKAFEIGVETIKVVWATLEAIVAFLQDYVIKPIMVYVDIWWTVFRTAVEVGVALVTSAFHVISEIVQWLKDNVWDKITAAVDVFFNFAGGVVSVVTGGVQAAKDAFYVIADIVSWVWDSLVSPVLGAFGGLWSGMQKGFGAAVSAVAGIWNTLADVAAAPVNFVIDTVYNDGIRKVWNFVASKIGLPELGEVSKVSLPHFSVPSFTDTSGWSGDTSGAVFATGGLVPGHGNKDTVPAMLTPDELVLQQKASRWWQDALGRRGALALLNEPWKAKTLDPGVIGYATGGYAHSPQEALDFAKQQAGKPYQFPLVGPAAFDCSGLISAVLAFIHGMVPPWRRLVSTASIQAGQFGLEAGDGDPSKGLTIGVARPYMVNQQGATVGHMAGTLMGTNLEAAGSASGVRVGAGARGWNNGLFGEHFFLKDFGGLSDEEKAIAQAVVSLGGIGQAPSGGQGFGDAISSLFADLPEKVFNFITGKLPSAIVHAIEDAVGSVVGGVTGLFGGHLTEEERQRVYHQLLGMGAGGIAKGPVLTPIGEAGPELVAPLPSNFDIADLMAGDRTGGDRIGLQITGETHFHDSVDLDAAFRMGRFASMAGVD